MSKAWNWLIMEWERQALTWCSCRSLVCYSSALALKQQTQTHQAANCDFTSPYNIHSNLAKVYIYKLKDVQNSMFFNITQS